MPNKYEREIEEILRNMDRADHGQSLGDRVRAFNRPAPRTRLARSRPRVQLSAGEMLLALGVILALVGAGIRYYFGLPDVGLYAYVAGGVGAAALFCIICGLAIGWRQRFGHKTTAMWRGQAVNPPRTFRPFAPIVTQYRILQLKWRYWRSRGR